MVLNNILNVGSAFTFDNALLSCLCNLDDKSPIVDDFFICKLHCKNPSTICKIDSGGQC